MGGMNGIGYLVEMAPLTAVGFLAGIPFLATRAVAEGKERGHASYQLANAGYWAGFLAVQTAAFPLAITFFGVVVPLLVIVMSVSGGGIVETTWRMQEK